jgi:hypothetical protein
MTLTELQLDSVLYVAENMREWDKKEVYAGRWTDDPYDLSADICSIGGVSFVAGHSDEPIAVVGAIPVHPTLWSVFMFATDKFPEIGMSLTKFLKRTYIPGIFNAGALRGECRSMEGHTQAQEWLECLGAVREATLPMVGKNGETFHIYGFTRSCPRTD